MKTHHEDGTFEGNTGTGRVEAIGAGGTGSVTEEKVWEVLREVIDPEMGMNLVDLGLIYSVRIGGGRVEVVMTVTTPGCPMEQSLVFGVETVVLGLDGVTEVAVSVVREPAWSPSMMTPEGRAALGIR